MKKGWKPKTDEAWIWYLERKINYGDLRGLDAKLVRKFMPKLHIDPGKRLLMNTYFKRYGAK